MADLIFLDANIPMYAAGRAHPLKQPCIDVLTLAARHPATFVTDAEVFQEILHRYRAIGRWPEGEQLFQRFAALMQGRIVDVQFADLQAAVILANTYPGLDARDLLHLAIMRRVSSSAIVTADAAFDRVAGIRRLNPAMLAQWRRLVEAPGTN